MTIDISKYNFYGFFTKYSMFDNYGFVSGLTSRIFRWAIPILHDKDSFENYLVDNHNVLLNQTLSIDFGQDPDSCYDRLQEEIETAILALSSKVISFGLDKRFKLKLDKLGLSTDCLLDLNYQLRNYDQQAHQKIVATIEEVRQLFRELRVRKHQIGTSLQLTYETRLIIKYLDRLENLVILRTNINNKYQWRTLIKEYQSELKDHQSITKYIKGHYDLLLLQIVEHTSSKGEKYIAEDKDEIKSFIKKSMLGGALISLFALLKIMIDAQGNDQIHNAILYSINYACCFIIVYFLGGIIATKQPAMTAATIAKKIDEDDNLKIEELAKITSLVKNVSRTQFVSFLGNVGIALPLAIILMVTLQLVNYPLLIEAKKIAELSESISFLNISNLYYAAIAGVFLSLSGFISGYVDNRIVFSNLVERIKNLKFLKLIMSTKRLNAFSTHFDKHLGASIGNIALGIFLGSAFLISELSPLAFDIRHIAFSASYLGIIALEGNTTLALLVEGFIGVWLIGFVNFLVSFLLTLFITFKTRGITKSQLNIILKDLSKSIVSKPISFLKFP